MDRDEQYKINFWIKHSTTEVYLKGIFATVDDIPSELDSYLFKTPISAKQYEFKGHCCTSVRTKRSGSDE